MDEDRREHGEVLEAAEGGGGGHVQPEPEQDLAKVVRVARHGPEAGADELVLVGGVAPQHGLLEVRQALEGHADGPERPAEVVPGSYWRVAREGVEEEGGEEGDEDPHALDAPED